MDAFGVHMPDNTVDLLEVGQREVKPFGNEELPSALAPIVARSEERRVGKECRL